MSTRDDFQLFIRCEIVKYLDRSGILRFIQVQAEKWRRNCRLEKKLYSNINIPIHIDLLYLIDEYRNLAAYLLKEPELIKNILKETIHLSFGTFLEESSCENIQIGQIHSPILLNHVPYCIQDMNYSNDKHHNGLTFMKGVLTTIGPKREYIRQSVWQCEECENSIQVISKIPFFAPKCQICNGYTVEFRPSRDSGVMMKATFVKTDTIDIKTNQISIGRDVLLYDDLMDILELGQEYALTLVSSKTKVECWGIEPIAIPVMDYNHLPNNLRRIYSQERHPWGILFEMCWSLNDGVTSSDAFIHLSAGLLLSIASIQPEESHPPVSVLALGSDVSTAALLFKEAASLAKRSSFVTASFLQSGEYRKESEGYEANAIVLSKTGVAVLGNWSVQSASPKNIFYIKSILESGKIKVCEEKAVHLKSSLWTYWDVTKSSKDQHQLTTLINLFGISFQADCQQIDSLADYLLIRSIEPRQNNFCNISKQDMKDIYRYIANWPVTSDGAAEALLKDYFRTVRKDRSERVPLRTLKVLDALAKANARLNLRRRVIKEDVLFAIYLHQHSQLVLFGDTGLSTPPMKNVKSLDEIEDIAGHFEKWLQKYITALIGETVDQYQYTEITQTMVPIV